MGACRGEPMMRRDVTSANAAAEGLDHQPGRPHRWRGVVTIAFLAGLLSAGAAPADDGSSLLRLPFMERRWSDPLESALEISREDMVRCRGMDGEIERGYAAVASDMSEVTTLFAALRSEGEQIKVRTDAIATERAKLDQLQAEIEALSRKLQEQREGLEHPDEKDTTDTAARIGAIEAFNREVDRYNTAIEAHRGWASTFNEQIEAHNRRVADFGRRADAASARATAVKAKIALLEPELERFRQKCAGTRRIR